MVFSVKYFPITLLNLSLSDPLKRGPNIEKNWQYAINPGLIIPNARLFLDREPCTLGKPWPCGALNNGHLTIVIDLCGKL